MLKWLQGMVGPTVLLWFYAIALGVATGAVPEDAEFSNRADAASSVALPLIIAIWVLADARKRGKRLCYDYDAFFFWLVVVPVYLFQTRGARALITLLCFGGIWLAAMLVAGVCALAREFLFS